MVDYEFYVNTYLGTQIEEKDFSGVLRQAQYYLEHFRRIYLVGVDNEISLKMALCAMAETLYAQKKREPGVSAASVGGVSVRYESTDLPLQSRLLDQARVYLDIYRGVC